MKKPWSSTKSLCGEEGFRAFGCCPAIWGLNTRRAGLLLALVSMALHSCAILPIPTPEHGLLSGRGEITQADVASLEVGKTTLEDVLLRFGEPSASLDGGKILVYHWQTVRGYVLWAIAIPAAPQAGAAGAGAADIAAVAKGYVVLLEFDETGRISRFERSSLGLLESLSDHIDQWTSPGSAKLKDIEKATRPDE